MKIRNSFVTNSSSSSFCIHKKDTNKDISKDKIENAINDVLTLYKKYITDMDYLKKHDWNDWQVFEGEQIENIAEALHNESWSASGVKIPDNAHKMFSSLSYGNEKMRPTFKQFWNTINDLIHLYGEDIVKNIIDFESVPNKQTDKVLEVNNYIYYDKEFQDAIRADFVVITGENVFPYSCIDLIEDILQAEYTHLG